MRGVLECWKSLISKCDDSIIFWMAGFKFKFKCAWNMRSQGINKHSQDYVCWHLLVVTPRQCFAVFAVFAVFADTS